MNRLACGASPHGVRHVEQLMGASVTVDVRDGPSTGIDLAWAVRGAVDWLRDADRRFSAARAGSIVSQFRTGTRSIEQCPADMVTLVLRCAELRERTDGWFDPWAMPGGFDPTGLSRGWVAAQALAQLARRGARHAVIAAGGDVALMGDAGGTGDGSGWVVGVQDPFRGDRLIAAVRGTALGVATSGRDEAESWTFDSRGGQVVRRLASATMVAADLAVAGACAAAASAHGPQSLYWLDRDPGLTALLVTASGQAPRTRNWPTAWDLPS